MQIIDKIIGEIRFYLKAKASFSLSHSLPVVVVFSVHTLLNNKKKHLDILIYIYIYRYKHTSINISKYICLFTIEVSRNKKKKLTQQKSNSIL